ncbi:hypothetical protein C8F01DRAFT_1225828 [Mycena amicta]|nr:hypothetical protein C8F01DRAFT_1225828 [Mycena amicta]
MSTNSFLAQVEKPPAPIVLLLAHTDIGKPTFPGLLMHEDLDDLPLAPNKSKVAFVAPSSPPPTYPPAPKMMIRGPAPISAVSKVPVPPGAASKVPIPDGGASRVTAKHFAAATGWSDEKINIFTTFVQKVADTYLDAALSASHQDPQLLKEVTDQIAHAFPEVDDFDSRWPIDTVVINWCKASRVTEKKASEKAVVQTLDNAINLRAKKVKRV